MSEKLKRPKKDALEKIKGSMDKLAYQPVSKRIVDALIKEGELERQKDREEKKIASPKTTPEAGL